MTPARLKAWPKVRRPPGMLLDEQRHHLRPSDRDDAYRHADLDRAWPDRAELPLRDDTGADRGGGPQALHWNRELRDHGDPVLHFGRKLPDAWRCRPTDDPVCHVNGWPLVRRHGSGGRHGL